MTNTVGFPGLFDKVFEINNTAFHIGNFSVAWYGVILACGFLLAALYAIRRTRDFGLTQDNFIDLLLWALPISIIGARLYYVVYKLDYYSANPSEIFKLWEGGLAIYGAIIAAFLTVLIFGKIRKLDVLSILDLGCLGLLIGQFIGRWANFVNAEAFGYETAVAWGMSINGGVPVHPTFLYESLWNFIGFLALHFYSKHRRFRGEITLLYIGWYGLGRAWIEGMRSDSLYIGAFRVSQLVAIASFVFALGVLLYFYISKKYTKPLKSDAVSKSEGE